MYSNRGAGACNGINTCVITKWGRLSIIDLGSCCCINRDLNGFKTVLSTLPKKFMPVELQSADWAKIEEWWIAKGMDSWLIDLCSKYF